MTCAGSAQFYEVYKPMITVKNVGIFIKHCILHLPVYPV